MTLRVLLVDDHELIRQGLRRAFEREDGFVVSAEAASLDEARRHDPAQLDVAVVDLRLADGDGLDLVKHLRAAAPEIGIVVLTMYSGDDHLFAALDAGASAFVSKDSPSSDVVAAARHAAASPGSFTAADLANAMRRRTTPSGPQLSPREDEVLQLLAAGLSVAKISKKLFISESTTKTHISKIYDKLDAKNRAQAIMAAVRMGLVSAETAAD